MRSGRFAIRLLCAQVATFARVGVPPLSPCQAAVLARSDSIALRLRDQGYKNGFDAKLASIGMGTDGLNLGGSWKGIFNYPRSLPPSQFNAELRDHMGALSGETLEIGDRRNKGQPIYAMLQGQRTGSDVSFVKRYDDLARARHPVHYSGRANDDGTEISGTWTIPGHWYGTFLMIRAKPKAAVVEQKIAETVR